MGRRRRTIRGSRVWDDDSQTTFAGSDGVVEDMFAGRSTGDDEGDTDGVGK